MSDVENRIASLEKAIEEIKNKLFWIELDSNSRLDISDQLIENIYDELEKIRNG